MGNLTLAPVPAGNGGGVIGFIVSGLQIVLMSTDTNPSAPELILGQK
ncbi:MAG TPA: hypothetical protein VJN69_03450 [Candidatus Acidoferrales bacterium]|nr:hypothetical protein [Candidatus Acidoferrales bacterium]